MWQLKVVLYGVVWSDFMLIGIKVSQRSSNEHLQICYVLYVSGVYVHYVSALVDSFGRVLVLVFIRYLFLQSFWRDIATLAEQACFRLRMNVASIHYLNRTCELIISATHRKKPCGMSSVVRFVLGAKTERRSHVICRRWHNAYYIKTSNSRLRHCERAWGPVPVS